MTDYEKIKEEILLLKLQLKSLEVKMELVAPADLLKFQSKVVATLSNIGDKLRDYEDLKMKVNKHSVYVLLGAGIVGALVSYLMNQI